MGRQRNCKMDPHELLVACEDSAFVTVVSLPGIL